ncbi:MAG: ribonuclease D [Gammaproteobacteria bacterium]|nr:ribonuclease D [Gammaproteobacteria bacterium]
MSPALMQAMIEQARWVATDAAFDELCASARDATMVALDTEFERTDTFYPKLALVQFCIGEQIVLVDPLAISDPTPLRELLADAGTRKVLHACSEDVEVLASWCGARPASLFDTQIAAAFCGSRYGIGYRDLVADAFAVTLDKDETRSNWLQRPLSPAQMRYAALDVALLLPLACRQIEQLEACGRLGWLEEECGRLVLEVLDRPGPEQAWRNVKRASSLESRGLAALMALAAWREELARSLDRPRGWLVKDEHLLQIASELPADLRDLDGQGVPPAVIRRWGDELQDIIDRTRELSPSELPHPLPPPMTRADGERLKQFRKRAQHHARDLGLAEELLARKRLLEPLFAPAAVLDDCPDALKGWRWEILGPEIEGLLNEVPQ